MKLNDKQIKLLELCRQQGHLTPDDVDIVYHFSEPKTYWQFRKLNRIKFQILMNLELRGYLVRVRKFEWRITKKSLQILKRMEMKKCTVNLEIP